VAANCGGLKLGFYNDIISNPIRGFRFNPIEGFVPILKAWYDIVFFNIPENMHAPAIA